MSPRAPRLPHDPDHRPYNPRPARRHFGDARRVRFDLCRCERVTGCQLGGLLCRGERLERGVDGSVRVVCDLQRRVDARHGGVAGGGGIGDGLLMYGVFGRVHDRSHDASGGAGFVAAGRPGVPQHGGVRCHRPCTRGHFGAQVRFGRQVGGFTCVIGGEDGGVPCRFIQPEVRQAGGGIGGVCRVNGSDGAELRYLQGSDDGAV